MAVTVNVTRRRRDKNYYNVLHSPIYAYANSVPATPQDPPEGVGVVEKGRLENVSSRSVAIIFVNSFTVLPIVTYLKVYRWVLLATGNYQQQQVLYKYVTQSPLTVSSLSLEIDASESLTGVIVEYVIQ